MAPLTAVPSMWVGPAALSFMAWFSEFCSSGLSGRDFPSGTFRSKACSSQFCSQNRGGGGVLVVLVVSELAEVPDLQPMESPEPRRMRAKALFLFKGYLREQNTIGFYNEAVGGVGSILRPKLLPRNLCVGGAAQFGVGFCRDAGGSRGAGLGGIGEGVGVKAEIVLGPGLVVIERG